jgi:GT2 family glycosyltransferase
MKENEGLQPPDIAIIILNWNGRKFLGQFLPSVIMYSDLPDVRIIVADNHSDDDSVEYIRENFPSVELLLFESNLGFAAGYKEALVQVDADYFVLLNSDVQVTPGWLEPMISLMEKDATIAACQPKIRSFGQKEYFEYAGAAGGFIDLFGYPFCRGRILDVIERDTGQYDDTGEIFWASGACLVIKSSCYFEAGGLDSMFFAHMEEIDLCWRLHNLGYKVYCVAGSLIYHVGGGTLPNNNPRKIYLNHRNNLYVLVKNLPLLLLLPVITVRMILDLLSALGYLVRGSKDFFVSVLKAHRDFIRNLPALLGERQVTKNLAGFGHAGKVYMGSILVDYFILGKRKFSQIKSLHSKAE